MTVAKPPWEVEAEEEEARILAEHGPVAVIDYRIDEQRRALVRVRSGSQVGPILRARIDRLLDERSQLTRST